MLAVALGLAAAATAGADEVVVIGDSWGSEGGTVLAETFRKHGSPARIVNIAVTGSTARHWSSPEQLALIHRTVSRPRVAHVWVSVGGNDAIHELPTCGLSAGTPSACSALVMKAVEADLRSILGTIHTANPNASVVGFGYDILRFGGSAECTLLGYGMFPACRDDALCVNTQVVKMQSVWEGLAASAPYVRTVNLLGTLQHAGGVPGAAVGKPVLDQWSPASLMQVDCVHPTASGFRSVFDAMWLTYWRKVLQPLPDRVRGPATVAAAQRPSRWTSLPGMAAFALAVGGVAAVLVSPIRAAKPVATDSSCREVPPSAYGSL